MLKLFAALPLAIAGIQAGAVQFRSGPRSAAFRSHPPRPSSRVEMTRVDFLPGQEMPEHLHPVPVVCVVSKGSFPASIGREPERKVTVGDTTIEPAGEVVHYFRNLSKRDPAQLYCAILAGPDDKQLSVMLNK